MNWMKIKFQGSEWLGEISEKSDWLFLGGDSSNKGFFGYNWTKTIFDEEVRWKAH